MPSNPRHLRVKQLFLEALDLHGEARERFLEPLATEDPELVAEVRAMLEADAEGGSVLEAANPLGMLAEGDGKLPDSMPDRDSIPDRIDDFDIIRVVGQGGMGVVYEARQSAPQRRVALKLMRSAIAAEESRARFAREVELLGRLQHRGIAQVLTSGSWSTPVGQQPYLVMEFLEGVPITEYAAGKTDRQKVELVALVADAIEHAHQRAVVHRDLKPANILVTADGEPKVLDFGVARALEAEAGDSAGNTRTGQVIGTPAYMSPEQAAGDLGLVDARTDVHALGALLFELLTGELPRDVRDTTMTEALDRLRKRPATRLRARRPELRGDLDTVVGKALEHEVSDRYLSAASFASDLRRYLEDRPIEARPPSAIYQLRKFARRNRAIVGGTIALILLLTLGLGGTLYGLGRSIEERDEARREATKATTVVTFLQDMLASAKPEQSLGDDVTVAAVLEEAVDSLDAAFQEEPEVEAALRFTVGSTYASLSRFDEADEQLERALQLRRQQLGDLHLDTAAVLYELGRSRMQTRQLGPAQEALGEALRIRRALLDAPHADIAIVLDSLGSCARRLKKFEAAESYLSESLTMREALADGPDLGLAATLGHLAQLRSAESRYEEAEQLFRRYLAINEELYPELHPDVATARNNLASLLHDRGDYEEAGRFYDQALAAYRTVYGDDHLAVAQCLNNYASLLQVLGRLEQAEERFLESLAIRERVVGVESISAAVVHNNLGSLYNGMREFDKAGTHYRRAIEIREGKLDPGHPHIVQSRSGLAVVRYYQKDPAGAAEEFRAVLVQLDAAREGMDREKSVVRQNLCSCLLAVDKPSEALEAIQPAYEWRKTELGMTHDDTCVAACRVGDCLRRLDRAGEAETLLLETWESLESAETTTPLARIEVTRSLFKVYEAMERPEPAQEWQARFEAARRAADREAGR